MAAQPAGGGLPHDGTRIRRALDDLDYTLILEGPLWQSYDGACDPATFAPGNATWWTRYFDYLGSGSKNHPVRHAPHALQTAIGSLGGG
ncbi:hypothetical protein [Micromonospora sp. DT229]|uniref:hypothetical protein n=1 Tax=Micromonospora sp. DT229 TaxID=3393430 RepID=UPI003CFAEFC9